MTLHKLADAQLSAERERYADQLARANGNVEARHVATARLATRRRR